MKLILLALVLASLSSCVGKEIQASIAPIDTPHVEYQSELIPILDSFPIVETPIHFDSTFFKKQTDFKYENGNLNREIVQLLSQKFANDEISSRENYYVNAFIEIEEAKANEKYAEYQANLESGMTENAVCRSLGRIELGDSVGLLLWEIQYESYPACPFYKGHHVLGTLIYKGKTISCMHIASNESGADAPMQFESLQLASLYKNGAMYIRSFGKTFEGDELIENTFSIANYLFSSTGFELKK